MKIHTHTIPQHGKSAFFISDIHSNLPALKAVLSEIPDDSLIFCAGDIVGYYLEPNEVCNLLKARSVFCIQGNHDKYVLGKLAYCQSKEFKYRIIETREKLTNSNLQWLNELPDCINILLKNNLNLNYSRDISITIAHGSPRNVEEYIYPDTPIDFLIDDTNNFLILGHTHHPMERHAGSRVVINPGSVGQARDRIPGACFASIELLTRKVNFHRITYQIEKYQSQLINIGYDSSMIKILSR
jgi:predicted phosphodiesterase